MAVTGEINESQGLFNHRTGPGDIEIPTNNKELSFLRIANISGGDLEIDISIKQDTNIREFFLCYRITILDGAGIEFFEDELIMPPGFKLVVNTPVANSFSAMYKFK